MLQNSNANESQYRSATRILVTFLVELEGIQQLEELPVLLRVLQLDVVLLQPVQGQLGLVVDVDLHRLQRKEGPVLVVVAIID